MKQLWVSLAFSSILSASAIVLPDHFSAHFTQQITNTDKKTIEYKGTVRFSDQKMLKWEYQEPTKKEVCTNGQNITIVDHDLEQVSYFLIEKGFDLAKILANAKLHKPTVYLAKYEGKQYTIQVDSKGQLSRVAYYDDLDNKVLIIFDKMQYGKGNLSLESMLCPAPVDYDVIGE